MEKSMRSIQIYQCPFFCCIEKVVSNLKFQDERKTESPLPQIICNLLSTSIATWFEINGNRNINKSGNLRGNSNEKGNNFLPGCSSKYSEQKCELKW